MSAITVSALMRGLDPSEEHVFLDALYPSHTRGEQLSRACADRRTRQDRAVVLAMAAVLRHRERRLVVRPRSAPAARFANTVWEPRPVASIEDAPPFPVLKALRGGPFDIVRMGDNAAMLRDHADQVDRWAETVEEICRAKAMVIAMQVAEREAAARIAQANAVIAEAEALREQAAMNRQLFADTLPERRDLARAIAPTYAVTKKADHS